jgi:hypothetical protein
MYTMPLVVQGLQCFSAQVINGRIQGDFEIESVLRQIMSGNIVILKGVFTPEQILPMRHKAFQWGQGEADNNQDRDNFHCILQGVSKRQKTPHAYHAYNFENVEDYAQKQADSFILSFFDVLRDFQNRLNGVILTSLVSAEEDGYRFHPQFIQYPCGFGHFGKHIHPLKPQLVGTIVSLSSKGVDYQNGGTCFETPDGVVDIEESHQIGDIAFFRFDLPHWVKAIDPEQEGAWDREQGRWVAALPYYAHEIR